MTGDFTGELFVLGGVLLAGVLGWVGTIIAKRLREPTSYETLWTRVDALTRMVYGDEAKKEPGLVQRMEASERVAGAQGRVIRDLARQWEGDPPRLNPADLDELDPETIPLDHPWRVKP